jgi:predicted DNA-binding transcriptional regulator YafY
MRGAQLLETRARELSKSELDEYLKSGYGIFAGREVEWATLKFTPLSARWVSRQSWHSKQRVRVDADGSLIIEIPYADDRELLMEVMRYGDEVEVLGPAALRGRVVDTLRKALKRYR